MSEYIPTGCDHQEYRKAVRLATGINILNKQVTVYLEDWECKKCGLNSIRLFRGSYLDAMKVMEALK